MEDYWGGGEMFCNTQELKIDVQRENMPIKVTLLVTLQKNNKSSQK